MEASMAEKIAALIEAAGLGQNGFEDRVGWSRGMVSKVFKGGGFTVQNLIKIFEAFPNLSTEWWFKSNGPMWLNRSEEYTLAADETVPYLVGNEENKRAKNDSELPRKKGKPALDSGNKTEINLQKKIASMEADLALIKDKLGIKP